MKHITTRYLVDEIVESYDMEPITARELVDDLTSGDNDSLDW